MGTDRDVSRIRFGGFELQPGERRLLAHGQLVAVGPRAFDLLVALIERAGKLVSKDELLSLVWPKLVVEEANLHVQVSALRKIIGAESIATIPGHGYRFTLELESVPDAKTPPPAAPKHNLPEQVTSFIGRAREMAEIGSLLGSHRLLTLLGVGGIGKTRLALQVAAGVIGGYSDGVWFAELAPLADDWLVPQAVAGVLGVKEEAGRPVIEALVKFVKDRRLLLILDNCEHLARACAELARQLLRAGPQVRILATSRDYLHVASETTFQVAPLGIPVSQTADVAAVLRSEAGQLFSDRAVASQSAFHVTPHNAPAIAEICRRLDGIPLALELAAARVRALSPGKIAERLGDRFRVLTGGDTTALPRQQTLRACIDWSYELLTEREKVLLRRLSVFAGGGTLEAAEAVGAGGEVAAADVLDLLTRLVEKSLVVLEADGERHGLLETIRQYAAEQLNDSGEATEVRTRHLAYFVALAEKVGPKLQGAEAAARLAELDAERENLLAAHEWCGCADGGAELGLRLVAAIRNYWIHRDPTEPGIRVTIDALSRAQAQTRSQARCRALDAASLLLGVKGRFAEVPRYSEEALSIAQEIGDEAIAARSLSQLGLAAYMHGSRAEARRLFERSLVVARRLPETERAALSGVLSYLAELDRVDGDLAHAESLLEEALSVSRSSESTFSAAILLNLAAVSVGRCFGDLARDRLLDALEIVDLIDSKLLGQGVVEVAAGLASHLGDCERAARLWGAASAQFERMALERQPVDEVFILPLIAQARKATGPSAFAAAENEGRALSYEDAVAETRAWLKNWPRLRAVG